MGVRLLPGSVVAAVSVGVLIAATGVAGAWDDDDRGSDSSSSSWHDGWEGADTVFLNGRILQYESRGRGYGPTDYWVDNWVIPTGAEHPVAAHKWIDFVLDPVNAGKEMNYHQYAVPVTGIEGVDPELANDPVINVPDERIQDYESQIQTARGLQQRNRAYTEFKAA
jgi:hypothetical protein